MTPKTLLRASTALLAASAAAFTLMGCEAPKGPDYDPKEPPDIIDWFFSKESAFTDYPTEGVIDQ